MPRRYQCVPPHPGGEMKFLQANNGQWALWVMACMLSYSMQTVMVTWLMSVISKCSHVIIDHLL